MKKLLMSLCVLAGILAAGGCEAIEDDWIIDWAPVNIYITATDSDGNSIISPDMPGMSLTFKGETYTVKDWATRHQSVETRLYLAILSGLFAQPSQNNDGTYRLYFGEIDGAADMDEDIVLIWPDGSKDTIHYHCSDHRGGRNADCKRSWKLNGKKYDGPIFKFTGKNL